MAKMAPRFAVVPTITTAALSEANIELAFGNHCISVNHKTQVTSSMLHALSKVGVTYISTRSTGYNHIDVDFAKSVGITEATHGSDPGGVHSAYASGKRASEEVIAALDLG